MMTQYTDKVEQHGLMIAAQKWANAIAGIHSHSLSSMHYDDRPQDTEGTKCVTDIEYNCGVIKRYQSGNLIAQFGEFPQESELVDRFQKYAIN